MSNSVFDLKKLEIKEENRNKYYTIPTGTKIYRGGFPADMHSNAFFGFDPDHVKQYGSVTEYIIKDDLKVLAIMEMDTSSNFYTSAPKIQDALIQSYSYTNTKKIRDSIPAYDYAVVNHICDNTTYHGYAMHDSYKTESGGIFHAELVICDCYDRVEQGEKGEQAPPRVERKKRPAPKYNSPLSEVAPSIGLFQSPDESPEKKELGNSETKRLLFGSPNHSPLKLKLDFDDNGKKSGNINANLFNSQPSRGGGKRKTRKRKTKRCYKGRKKQTRKNRRTRSKKVKH